MSYDKLISKVPVNKNTAMAMSGGDCYEVVARSCNTDQDTPYETKPTPKGSPELVGIVKGRLKVIGFSKHHKKRWVAKCTCGNYCLRTARAIRNEDNKNEMCHSCYQFEKLKGTWFSD